MIRFLIVFLILGTASACGTEESQREKPRYSSDQHSSNLSETPTAYGQENLRAIILSDASFEVRSVAIQKLNNQLPPNINLLSHLALHDKDYLVRLASTIKMNPKFILSQLTYRKIARSQGSPEMRVICIRNLEYNKENALLFNHLASTETDDSVRIEAINRLQ